MLSIIIPCYNEALNVAPLYERLLAVLSDIAYDYEIIFIDDGSRDNTLDEIKKIAGVDKSAKFVKRVPSFLCAGWLKLILRRKNLALIICIMVKKGW